MNLPLVQISEPDFTSFLGIPVVTDLATLAAAQMAMGDMAKAVNYAEQALDLLNECSGQGPEAPQQDYFTCYQVLAAAGQDQEARLALQSAYELVMARAEKITDPSLRKSFLENVPINRQIAQEVQKADT